jgi:hypothetical protein
MPVTKQRAKRKPAADSLLRIPLVETMLRDPCVRIETRAIDAEWRYKKIVPLNLAGFNPATGSIFVSARSRLAAWLKDPAVGARALNDSDRLVMEVLYAVHDYLHVWGYRAIRELRPRMNFGDPREKRIDVEDWVFCHLLTEAIATVGLDYWYLSAVRLNDEVDLGTALNTLTTPYHERNRREYSRWNRDLRVQSPRFLETLTDVYCTGDFVGYDREALIRSPLVLQWVDKELMYGRVQRGYTRRWLCHLFGLERSDSDDVLCRPCAFGKPWQKRLVADIAARLWALVKRGTLTTFTTKPPVDDASWSDVPRPVDFRFTNIQAFSGDHDKLLSSAGRDSDNMKWYLRQLVTSYQLDDRVDQAAVSKAIGTGDVAVVRAALRDARPVGGGHQGPAHLFFLP